MQILDNIKRILEESFNLQNDSFIFAIDTPLLGGIPEMDSMSIVNIIAAIEENFDIEIADDDISAEVFESVGTLVAFIENKIDE